MRVNVLSLFDGMSCGRITLYKMGITPNKYYASELDKFAIKEVKANWPDTIHLGDVTKWREWDIDWANIDLLVGGSPCQGFSYAGKQLAFDDPRSSLFFVYVDILNHVKSVNPDVKFILENVRMKKEHLNVITEYLGVDPVFINSALVSAHSRPRYYWSNWEVTQPKDKKIYLKDILQINVDDKYFLSEKMISGFKNSKSIFKDRFKPHTKDTLKSYCLTARYFKMGKTDPYIKESERIRKLTIVECCRLQGVPDDYFKVSSNTQAYKMLGNGWQCDTIEHIFRCLFD